MALITCKECNKQISDRAISCSACGWPVEKDVIVSACSNESENGCYGIKSECSNEQSIAADQKYALSNGHESNQNNHAYAKESPASTAIQTTSKVVVSFFIKLISGFGMAIVAPLVCILGSEQTGIFIGIIMFILFVTGDKIYDSIFSK